MKKYLPLILFVLGVIVFVVTFFVVRGKNTAPIDPNDESSLVEVSLEEMPIVSLIPTKDGHYLKLKVENIVVKGVSSMDYELLYQTAADITQGVPGSVEVSGESFETDLLLGSESSGKFRFDEGVKTGSIGIKYRDSKGKLLAKFETDFELNEADDGFEVTMNTIGGSSEIETFSSE